MKIKQTGQAIEVEKESDVNVLHISEPPIKLFIANFPCIAWEALRAATATPNFMMALYINHAHVTICF